MLLVDGWEGEGKEMGNDGRASWYLQVPFRGPPPEAEYLVREGLHIFMVDSHILRLGDVRG